MTTDKEVEIRARVVTANLFSLTKDVTFLGICTLLNIANIFCFQSLLCCDQQY